MRRRAFTLPSLLLAAAAAQASPDFTVREAELSRAAVQALLAFARSAEAAKMGARAAEVYDLVLDHYESDNRTARTALGYRLVGNEWRLPEGTSEKRGTDAATGPARHAVERAWPPVATKIGTLHRELGLALLAADEVVRGHHHLDRALAFLPQDPATHRALGHQEIDGFFGTEEQIAFVRRSNAIRTKANELAQQWFEVRALDAAQMPSELRVLGLPITGVRSTHFTIWAHSSQEDTERIAQWAERTLHMLDMLLDCDAAARAQMRANAGALGWRAVLRSEDECAAFFAANPQALGGLTLAEVQRFGGHSFGERPGKKEVFWHDVDLDADRIVANVMHRVFGDWCNDGLAEGLMHAMTWLLVGTTHTRYTSLPATRGASYVPLRSEPGAWMTRLQAAIDAGKDWPLVEVARERSDNFRNETRLKTWSFMLWLVARHPEKVQPLLLELQSKRSALPEEMAALMEQMLGRPVAEVDVEWREWAGGRSAIAKATGFAR